MRSGSLDLFIRVLSLALILACGGNIAYRTWRSPSGEPSVPQVRPDMPALIQLPAGQLPGVWQWIIVHHSGTTGSSYEEIRIAFWKLGYSEVPFHFLIRPEGVVLVTSAWQQQVGCPQTNEEAVNRSAIGICVIGDFDQPESRPTPAQMESLTRLSTILMQSFGIRRRYVWPGVDIDPVDHPQTRFPWKSFLAGLPRESVPGRK
ncbi:MAG: peptidoglycan recognition family protein [Planctomycetota bacterium]